MNGKEIWHFIWHDDSLASWLVNILLAFVLIKFIVYPALGFLLGTGFPIVAVVSSSMHHDASFNTWWDSTDTLYEPFAIDKEMFQEFPFRNGFNKGDIMILLGTSPQSTKIGDVIVFQSGKPEPIIHRVVRKYDEGGNTYYQTKGDNYQTNPTSLKGIIDETKIPHTSESVKGRAVARIPLLGYIKILFVQLLQAIGIL